MAQLDDHASDLRSSGRHDSRLASKLFQTVNHSQSREWIDKKRGGLLKGDIVTNWDAASHICHDVLSHGAAPLVSANLELLVESHSLAYEPLCEHPWPSLDNSA